MQSSPEGTIDEVLNVDVPEVDENAVKKPVVDEPPMGPTDEPTVEEELEEEAVADPAVDELTVVENSVGDVSTVEKPSLGGPVADESLLEVPISDRAKVNESSLDESIEEALPAVDVGGVKDSAMDDIVDGISEDAEGEDDLDFAEPPPTLAPASLEDLPANPEVSQGSPIDGDHGSDVVSEEVEEESFDKETSEVRTYSFSSQS